MTFRTVTKRATILSLFLGILLAGSVAFAWWTAGGGGNGYAKAESPLALTTVNVSASTSGDLHPGGTGALKIQISNPNSYAVTVTDINANGAAVTVPTDAVCDAADSVSLVSNLTGLSVNVPAGGSTVVLTYANAVQMDGPTAVDACQGEVFAIPVSLVGTSA
jgi:hypothetical protein